MTPKMYNYYAYNDVLEPMRHVYDTYCAPVKRKCFAVGVSMGANILTNLLGEMGENCFLDAAYIIQNPMCIWETERPMAEALWGIYDTTMGKNMLQVYRNHEWVLRDHLKAKLGINLNEFKKTFNKPSLVGFDEGIAAKLYGYKDKDDYYYQASSVHRMPSIRIPCVFMQALDDPIVQACCILPDVFDNNPNLGLVTNRYGGHTAYFSSIWTFE
jgi:uncharacterized protein